ncbi:MAG: hypothetical protein PHR61_01120 [Candidatus Absconditabacteria bacterium]|jgi:hypothetical protein|nr:hypothetical protein [Candidatus Absconditabacteria bacterium]
MKKLLLFLVTLLIISLPSKAQFKGVHFSQDYQSLKKTLNPIKIIPVDNNFYVEWMDSLISIHRELAFFLGITYPLDTIKLTKKTQELSKEEVELVIKIKIVENFPQDELISEGWKKKPKKKRYYYEQQRLQLIKNIFEKAKQNSDIDLMGSTLELLAFYYQNRTLLSSEKLFDDYQDFYIESRNIYARHLSICLDQNNCQYNDVSKLFYLALNAWPDISLAHGILQRWFKEEWNYLFKVSVYNQEKPSFESTTECFLSLLYLYNVEGKKEVHQLTRGFKNLSNITHSEFTKNIVLGNIRRYLNEVQYVYPPQ